MSDKPLLFIVPIYIGSLKYYEKLLPALARKFNVRFLFVRPFDERRGQMEDYCRERGYVYEVLETGVHKKRERSIPIISALARRHRYQKACQVFLAARRPQKMIFVKYTNLMGPLMREAKAQGIETIVIQFAFTAGRNHYRKEKRVWRFDARRLYSHILDFLHLLQSLTTRGLGYVFMSAMPDRVGAIGAEGKWVLSERFGYDPHSITVVGNADWQRVAELRDQLAADAQRRETLAAQYGLSTGKRHILIMGSWLINYVDRRETFSKEEREAQIAYFERIIRSIRNVFSPEEADVLFKMHPAEENIYTLLERWGVRIYGDEALSEELLLLSDLYIADPATSANYMVMASGKPALFINFSELQEVNKTAPFFSIREVVTDFNRFESCLTAFKEDRLPLHYAPDSARTDSITRIVDFIAS